MTSGNKQLTRRQNINPIHLSDFLIEKNPLSQ